MLENLWQDLHNESYEVESPVNGEPTIVVEITDIDALIKKHDYLSLGGFLSTVAPYQIIAVKAGTTVNEFEFLGTAELALNNGIKDSFKNISNRPLEMNVVKVDVRTGYHVYDDAASKPIDNPILFVFVN